MVYLELFLAFCELCYLIGIIFVSLTSYNFREKKITPFFEKHRIIAGAYVILCIIGFGYFMFHLISRGIQ